MIFLTAILRALFTASFVQKCRYDTAQFIAPGEGKELEPILIDFKQVTKDFRRI
jgi:hypothetical protein